MAEEPKMEKHKKEVTVPSWLISIVQWAGPALVAVVAAYYKIDYIERDLIELRSQHVIKVEQIDKTRSDVVVLQERLSGYNDKISTSLNVMNDQLKSLNAELSNLRTLIMRTRETTRETR